MYSIEEFDELKTKVLKYVIFKKRTENEIRLKFKDSSSEMLNDVIEYLKEAGYISDVEYVERSIKEYMALKNMSIKELVYKLESKGIQNCIIEDYIQNHKEELVEYEIQSAKNIIRKKAGQDRAEIENNLYKKGYLSETIKLAFDEM